MGAVNFAVWVASSKVTHPTPSILRLSLDNLEWPSEGRKCRRAGLRISERNRNRSVDGQIAVGKGGKFLPRAMDFTHPVNLPCRKLEKGIVEAGM